LPGQICMHTPTGMATIPGRAADRRAVQGEFGLPARQPSIPVPHAAGVSCGLVFLPQRESTTIRDNACTADF
jgi:hypothetical protein